MSINHGAGAGGVGSATEPGPTAVNVKAEQSIYANNKPTSQAGNDALSFERVRKMVKGAIDYVKVDTTYGPAVAAFRHEYCRLMREVRDAEGRGYIKKQFKVLWAWLGRHDDRKHRHNRHDLSLILRDEIFKDGELRADPHPIQEVALPPERPAIGEQPPPVDADLRAINWGVARRRPQVAGAIVAPPDVPDDRPIQINAPAAPAPPHAEGEADVEAEDASLLDPPEVSDLPVTTPEARQAKRKLIEGMKAGRARPALRLIHSVAAPSINEPPPPQQSPELEEPLLPLDRTADFSEAVRPSKTTIPLDEKDQALCLGIQDKELRFLVRLYKAGRQERGEPFVCQADMIQQWGINRDILYETDEIGRRIGFTPEKDEFIGHNALGRPSTRYERKGKFITIPPEQFLKRITPGSETPAETKARRAKSKRPHRSKRRREIRAEQRAITKAQRAQVNDVDCRQSAVSVVLTTKWVTIVQLGKELPRTTAFRDRNGKQLTGRSLHQAILRTLKLAPLCDAIETQTRVGKFGNSILYMRRRS